MIHRTLVLAAFSLLVCSLAPGQEPVAIGPPPHENNRPLAQAGEKVPDKALMQEINDAWSTLDPDKAARYYDRSPANVFYDVAPQMYVGWEAYARGAREVLSTLSSMKYIVGDDTVIHVAGSFAWGTATLHLETIDKQGQEQVTDLRWTPLWEKKGDRWLLVHEHLSASLQPQQ